MESRSTETFATRFGGTARSLGRASRLRGLDVPTFRYPPGLACVQRSIRRRSGSATIAVVVRGRPWGAVVADMVEGIVVANDLDPARADTVRAALWLALEEPALAA